MEGSSSHSNLMPISNSDLSKNQDHRSKKRGMDHLKMPVTDSNGALMSARSGRSGQSGILA